MAYFNRVSSHQHQYVARHQQMWTNASGGGAAAFQVVYPAHYPYGQHYQKQRGNGFDSFPYQAFPLSPPASWTGSPPLLAPATLYSSSTILAPPPPPRRTFTRPRPALNNKSRSSSYSSTSSSAPTDPSDPSYHLWHLHPPLRHSAETAIEALEVEGIRPLGAHMGCWRVYDDEVNVQCKVNEEGVRAPAALRAVKRSRQILAERMVRDRSDSSKLAVASKEEKKHGGCWHCLAERVYLAHGDTNPLSHPHLDLAGEDFAIAPRVVNSPHLPRHLLALDLLGFAISPLFRKELALERPCTFCKPLTTPLPPALPIRTLPTRPVSFDAGLTFASLARPLPVVPQVYHHLQHEPRQASQARYDPRAQAIEQRFPIVVHGPQVFWVRVN
ncbi:hypothetical protein BDY24DRAFT_414024 [Mrakia frigida]|uniref:uncharacterized protein n=1 Tax=Mrakia frigida TaxID=29902 RepID=UPI003FCC1C08